MLALILKQNMYRYHCLEKRLTFEMYLSEIKTCEHIEQYNARYNAKTDFHVNKWGKQHPDEESELQRYIIQYVNQM